MPMLYDEGANAFRRLQEDILKVTERRITFRLGVEQTLGGTGARALKLLSTESRLL